MHSSVGIGQAPPHHLARELGADLRLVHARGEAAPRDTSEGPSLHSKCWPIL